mmetsp:Transcript_49101/g.128165  ORF Transcript_49101/g.128165 Transcript_49101/m.128165 type:complete len:120 (+) Transcript_49101:1-360(+)
MAVVIVFASSQVVTRLRTAMLYHATLLLHEEVKTTLDQRNNMLPTTHSFATSIMPSGCAPSSPEYVVRPRGSIYRSASMPPPASSAATPVNRAAYAVPRPDVDMVSAQTSSTDVINPCI